MKKFFLSILILLLIFLFILIFFKLNKQSTDEAITYTDENIAYTDKNGKTFTGIGTITFNFKDKKIKILDRNLGATTNDINNKNSYGYYFQRGNNYGFTLNTGEINTEEKQININGYGPSEYSNSTFNIGEYGERISIDSNDESKENLWGGGFDSQENERGLTSNSDIKLRQGPCPEGYHIPSIGERNQLIGLWIDYYTGSRDRECIFQDGFGFNKSSNQCKNGKLITKFYEIFKIPQAGELISWNLYHNTTTIDLRTSSFRYKFEGTYNSFWPLLETSYANAIPLRCFSDTNN